MESMSGSKMAILILKLILTEPESLCCDECRVTEQGVGEAAKGVKSDNKGTNKSELSEDGTGGRSHIFLVHIYSTKPRFAPCY